MVLFSLMAGPDPAKFLWAMTTIQGNSFRAAVTPPTILREADKSLWTWQNSSYNYGNVSNWVHFWVGVLRHNTVCTLEPEFLTLYLILPFVFLVPLGLANPQTLQTRQKRSAYFISWPSWTLASC